MIRLLADEDFDNRILRGLLRRQPNLDFVRVQDVGLSGANDAEVLRWAAGHKRVLLTHDVSTMTQQAYSRLEQGQSFAGVVQVPQSYGVGRAIEDVLILVTYTSDDEWRDRIFYLPFRAQAPRIP